MGIEKTLLRLKESYYFPKMRAAVESYVNRCINCLYYKTPRGKQPGYLHPLDKGSIPFECVHVDHLGPFIKSISGRQYVIVLEDGYSKYVVLKAVSNTQAQPTIKFMYEFMSHYGKPLRVITDRGTAFTAQIFEQFCDDHNIQHIKTASATPRANGQVERANSMILSCLATSTETYEGQDWCSTLFDVQWAINNSIHKVTKRSPAGIIFTYKVRGTRENPLTAEMNELNSATISDEEEKSVEQLLEENRVKMKNRYDKHRRPGYNYLPGDLVLVRTQPDTTSGTSHKLEVKYRRPYEIVKVLPGDRYLVQDIEGEQQSGIEVKYRRPYEIVKVLPGDRYLVQDIEGEQQSGYIEQL
ncbi:Integrase core domain [Popillia japonica]|uniref:RNA-directed DNA polymerase n=1 Tax=Popillia japonica TaxID=7064 RepID=A0AAW1IST6_POPJA